MHYLKKIRVVSFSMLFLLAVSEFISSVGAADYTFPEVKGGISIEKGKSMRERGSFETVWEHDGEISLNSQESKTFTIPPVAVKSGWNTVLALRCRLGNDYIRGWNNYLAIWINNRPVYMLDEFLQVRLLNRPNPMSVKGFGQISCLLDNQLLTFFSKSFDTMDCPLIEEAHTRENYWFILRVDSNDNLLRTDKENVIRLENTAKHQGFGAKKAEEVKVIVNPLEIGYFRKPAEKVDDKNIIAPNKFKAEREFLFDNWKIEINKHGGLCLTYGKEKFTLSSDFSYPNAGFNYFGRSDKLSQQEWKPEIKKLNEDLLIQAEGEQYRLERKIVLSKGRIDVYDTVKNLTDEILPIMVLNTLAWNEERESTWIGGMPGGGSISMKGNPCNPTIFMTGKSASTGVYVQDTVFRNQLWLQSSPGIIKFGTKELGIAPKKSYTLRWRLYTSDSPDYFSFINRIREDEKINFTITDLAFGGTYRGYEQYKSTYLTRPISATTFNPWFMYSDGLKYTKKQWGENAKPRLEELRKLDEDLLIIPCFEIAYHAVPKDADWSKLPCADSFSKNEDGSYRVIPEVCIDTNKTYITPYPALDNSYYKKLLNDIDFVMDEAGFNGVYFDIFTYANNISYDRWDGHSVEIDPKTYTVVRKINHIPIFAGPAEAEIIKHIRSKGGVVFFNCGSCTEEMQALPSMGFMEGTAGLVSTHLHSPIGLMNCFTAFSKEKVTAATMVDQIIQRLRQGCLSYYYNWTWGLPKGEDEEVFQILPHMFPITIVGIHAGWIEGKERLITCKPGTYLWSSTKSPGIFVWDAQGKRVKEKVPMQQEGNRWKVDFTNLPEGGIGIIEKN